MKTGLIKVYEEKKEESVTPGTHSAEHRAHRILIRLLLFVMAAEWLILLVERHWLSIFLVTLIIATLFAPILFRKKMQMEIPVEIHFTAVIFIFASYYLVKDWIGKFIAKNPEMFNR